jgi:REP element-mobilizing transposase RayT
MKGEFRLKVMQHIRSKIEEMDCAVRNINGSMEHLHVLFLLSPEKTLADVIQMAKGESAHWINQQNILKTKFAWQVGYCGLSVSESMVKKIEDYIRRQEEHHRKMSFQEEYERFMEKTGISINR